MLRSFRWVYVWGVASILAVSCLGKIKSPGSKRHQFFLTSAYTRNDVEINEDEFNKLYQGLAKQGVVVYRNGQTYNILVPLRKIYTTGTSNYKSGGEQIVKDLANFLGLYSVEYMSFTGVMFKSESLKEESNKGLKTSYKSGNKAISSDLKRENKILKPELVSLKQTSNMVRDMRKINKSFAGVAVSITDEIDKKQSLMHELAMAVNDQIMRVNNKIEAASILIREVVDGAEDLHAYADGGIMVEFKKF